MAPTWSLFFTTSPKLWEQDAWKAAVGVRVPIFAPGTPDPAFKGITDRDRSAVIQLAELIQKTKGKEERQRERRKRRVGELLVKVFTSMVFPAASTESPVTFVKRCTQPCAIRRRS